MIATHNSIEEVESFLLEMNSLLSGPDGLHNLDIILKDNLNEDKTFQFRVEHNLISQDILEELLQLNITNYAYTDYDDNARFSNEIVWIFGKMFLDEEVYIKLKIRSKVVCLSFHEKERDLIYPYL